MFLKKCIETVVSEFVAYVGYGNAAGFLMNRQIPANLLSPTMSATISNGSNQVLINPITGQAFKAASSGSRSLVSNMTDEEKEQEAEKLFVLFDRLNKTGVVKVVEPTTTDNASDKPPES